MNAQALIGHNIRGRYTWELVSRSGSPSSATLSRLFASAQRLDHRAKALILTTRSHDHPY